MFSNLLLTAFLSFLLFRTASWPQISDDVLMHYVVFLMRSGMAPYRQIIDVNMPGSYLLDASISAIFGGSDFAWRLFDWSLLMAAAICIFTMIGKRGWRAAWFASVLFALLHLSDGVAQAGQRDFIVAVLLLASSAFLLRGLRLSSPWHLGACGLWGGVAVTIKPQVVLLLPAIIFLIYKRRPRGNSNALAACGICGWLLPPASMCVWLSRKHALSAFLGTLTGLMPYHAGLARHPLAFLVWHALPLPMLALLLPLILAAPKGYVRYCDYQVALFGLLFGLTSFCLQGKAYPYHRYPLVAFAVLLAGLLIRDSDCFPPIQTFERLSPLQPYIPIIAMILYGTLWFGPACLIKTLRYNWRYQPSLTSLEADLINIGGGPIKQELQRQVQCLDTMAGCVTVLSRMRLVQATGFLYDCYFFAPGKSPVKDNMRSRFMTTLELHPPRVFVVTDQWCLNLPNGYGKLLEWPDISRVLETQYTLRVERHWSLENTKALATWPFGYRIYVRKASN